MWRIVRTALLVSCTVMIAAPATADLEKKQQTSPDEANKLVQSYFEDFSARKFDQALADISTLNADASNQEARAIIASLRASALLGLKRDAEAQPLIAEVHNLAPKEPAADSALLKGALDVGRMDVASATFDDMIARYPDTVRALDPDLVFGILHEAPQDQRNDDRRIGLSRIHYGGDTATGRYLAADASKILLRRGDVAAAGDLLQYSTDPQSFQNMLVQKRYTALWPALEKLSGPHMMTVRQASVVSAQRAYEAAPDDHAKLKEFAEALRHADRLDDVIALKAKLPVGRDAMSKADQDMGWAVDSVAEAFGQAGRLDESDQLFASLNEARGENDDWRVNTIINRLEGLVNAGKFAKAEPLLADAETWARDHGSPYAQQLVRRLRLCTYASLGKKEEAAMVLPDFLRHADDALHPSVDALLCAGEVDKAEQLALHGFNLTDTRKREQFEEDMIVKLQPVDLTSGDPPVWQRRWDELKKRALIAAAYQRLGRDLPAGLVPVTRRPSRT